MNQHRQHYKVNVWWRKNTHLYDMTVEIYKLWQTMNTEKPSKAKDSKHNAVSHLLEVSDPLIECFPECCHVSLSLFSEVVVISWFSTSQALQRFPEKEGS